MKQSSGTVCVLCGLHGQEEHKKIACTKGWDGRTGWPGALDGVFMSMSFTDWVAFLLEVSAAMKLEAGGTASSWSRMLPRLTDRAERCSPLLS